MEDFTKRGRTENGGLMLKRIEATRDTLTMHYPASWWRDTWREALVCGNGHMGASFYGGTRLQTIMITDGELQA